MSDNNNHDIFCENCNNILDVTRSVIKKDMFGDSEGDQDLDQAKDQKPVQNPEQNLVAVDYDTLLKKLEDGKKLTGDELSSIDVKEMVKSEYYKKMVKKGEIKKMIIDMQEDQGNSDENTRAYLICRNCAFTKVIENKFRVLSKNPEGSVAEHEFIDEANLRLKSHIRTMPVTRYFNCPNKKCPTYTENLASEAVFFRKNTNVYETIYVCRRCLTVKMN
jgi:hypothetical protein